MKWTEITTTEDFENLLTSLSVVPIFKHSIRCSISSMVKNRIERVNDSPIEELFLVDVINNRNLSNYIAEKSGIQHESPQLIIIKEGETIYHASHTGIDLSSISI